MPFFLALLSVVLCYLSPAEMFPELSPYHIQQFVLFPAVAATLLSVAMRSGGFRWPQDMLVVGLWGAVAASMLANLFLRGTMMAFLDFGLVVCVYALIAANAFSLRRIRIACSVLSLVAIVMAVEGILAYYTGFGGDKLVLQQFEPGLVFYKRIRAYGILNDPNDFAQFLIVGLALLGQFWRKSSRFSSLALLTVPVGVLMWAIYLTGSRGAIFGLAVVVYLAVSRRLGGLQSAIVGALFLLGMIGMQFGAGRSLSLHEGSAAGRMDAWGVGITVLKSKPLFGVGYGRFNEYHELTAHNSYVLCFSELGIFGYFFWLGLVVTTVWGMQRLGRIAVKTPDDEKFLRVASTLRAALYSFLATSFFLSRTYTLTFYALIALAAALIQLRRSEYPVLEIPARVWIPMTVACQAGSLIFIYVMLHARVL
jgi:putative inorganic carbon (hco3(-)) transporter